MRSCMLLLHVEQCQGAERHTSPARNGATARFAHRAEGPPMHPDVPDTPPDVAPVVLNGRSMTGADVVRVARSQTPVVVDEGGRLRVEASWRAARRVVLRRPVYGRTTGVGANRSEAVIAEDLPAHGLRLLRSHAGGLG